MDLMLNHILCLKEKEIENSKIELNMTAGRGGESQLDKWIISDVDSKSNGKNSCSYWGWYGEKRNFSEGQLVFSFIKICGDEWLFISAAKILNIPKNGCANVEILEKFTPLFGRMIIKYKKGNTFSRYVFNLKTILHKILVKEILPCQYNGEQFEGYDKVHLEYKKLKDIFDGKIMPTYYEALRKIIGIYCLTDRNTGKLYIGSASGEGGVAQRWGNYLESKHGGNKKLITLHKEKGDEYFKKNFTFTLIEYFGLSYDHEKLIEREQYWKNCFNTIENGYNDN